MPNMTMTNTWLAPCDEHYYYQANQPRQAPSAESSPISPEQLAGWFGSSPIEPPYVSASLPGPSHAFREEVEETEAETEVESTGGKRGRASDTDEAESPKKRRRVGEDGERKMIRSSRFVFALLNSYLFTNDSVQGLYRLSQVQGQVYAWPKLA
jgi:hypothetical protein